MEHNTSTILNTSCHVHHWLKLVCEHFFFTTFPSLFRTVNEIAVMYILIYSIATCVWKSSSQCSEHILGYPGIAVMYIHNSYIVAVHWSTSSNSCICVALTICYYMVVKRCPYFFKWQHAAKTYRSSRCSHVLGYCYSKGSIAFIHSQKLCGWISLYWSRLWISYTLRRLNPQNSAHLISVA